MSTTKADVTASTAEQTSASKSAVAAAPVGLVQQLGNQGLQTLLRARLMQAKLTVSHPQDSYEQEADRVADQVMRMPPLPTVSAPIGAIQRLPEPRALHRSAGLAADVPNVDATTEHGIQSLSGRGSALPASLRSFMEPRFNADFGAVRVHTDSHAHHLARAVNAQAFTIGPNVVFGAGRYAPETESGKRLIAHELTHVVQQSPASVTGPWRIQRQPASAETEAPPPQIEGAAKKIGFVRFHSDEQYLNLYSAPDELSKVVDVLEFGQRVHRVEGSNSASDGARAGEAVARRPNRPIRWLKVVVLGKTGYVDESRIHFPPPDLIQKDPGLRLIRVRHGLTFYGLVHEMYGIKGDESTKDLNMNHFINAIRSVNKKGAFDVKTDALDRAGNFLLSGRDAKNTYLKANYDLWIPSIGVAAKMDVGSGTIRGELVRIEKKIEQILQDFKDAALMSGDYIWDAVKSRAGDVGMGLISGLVDFAKDALLIMAAATAAGAVIGAILGAGAGAVPGMEIGFEIGLLILDIYGVYFLVETVLSMAGALVGQLGRFIALVLDAKGDKKQLDLAARALADALGILASAMLVAIAAYVLKKGSEGLMKTKFAQTVGRTRLGEWIKDRQRLKTTDERVSAAAEKARENTRAREAERARDAAPPGMTWAKTGDGVEVLVPKSSPRSSRGTKVDPARFKKGVSVSAPKRPTVIDLEVNGNAARVPGGSPKGGALQVVPRTSPPAARVNVGSFNPARNATVGAGLERTRSGAVAETGKAIDETGPMTARGDVISASAPRVPRHIPTTLPTPAAPADGVRVPASEPDAITGEDPETPRPGREALLNKPAPNLSEGPTGNASGPLTITHKELQLLAVEALRRPVSNLDGKVRVHPTVKEFEDAYARVSPNTRPPVGNAGFFDPGTGEIHLSPTADLDTAIHEVMHMVRQHADPDGRQYVGAFLDEGVTEAVIRARLGANPERSGSGYDNNIKFYQLLKKVLGSDKTVEIAILHGEYEPLRAEIKALFGGDNIQTELFFARMRSIGERGENRGALVRAVEMLKNASKQFGPPASRLPHPTVAMPIELLRDLVALTKPQGGLPSTGPVVDDGSPVQPGVTRDKPDVSHGEFNKPPTTHPRDDATAGKATALGLPKKSFVLSHDDPATEFDDEPTVVDPTPSARSESPEPEQRRLSATEPNSNGPTPTSAVPTAIAGNSRDSGLPKQSFTPSRAKPGPQPDNGPTNARPRRLPAIIYKGRGRLPDGRFDPDRLITVWNGEPVYISSGTSPTLGGRPGTPVFKVAGEAYRFAGVQEETQTILYPREWMIKHEARTNMAPIPELRNAEYAIQASVQEPEEVNAWLARNGAIPYIDIRHYMGWLDPDPE